ncbi:TPA: hypothetical protein QDB07_001214 [Burkholderia vietnamiensis]|jgi:hypothetical protein|uniref:hypothetical protein n=1 Tax=Burkholderia vietnamiensis TaxID=60552 RepID=UPI00075D4835|nr:hypothetical protein [Burkholderia vietnamiensis]KVF35768.1 hypothetical protein WJ09_09745 [Burkholderia vietnamiensis]HDR9033757.1 hypothetical protein [Burkholderia vietnamiensis]
MDRIDELLLDWYEWSQGYNPGVDYQAFDSSTAQFRSSRQWMEYEELNEEVDWQLKKTVGKLIEPMIQKLDLRARVAINTAMRNFSVGASVWSSPRLCNGLNAETEYMRAKTILCPQMIAAGLIQRDACKALESAL